MDEKELELAEKLDEILEEVRKLREGLSDEDKEDREGDEDEDKDGLTEEEALEKIDELLEEYEETEQRLKKLQKRSARIANIQSRHSERAAQTDRVGSPITPHTDRSNTRNGRHQYSLMRAIRGQTEAILGQGPGLNGLELEVHQELASQRGKAPSGVLIPWDAGVPGLQTRNLSTSTGSGAVGMQTIPSMIDVLRARLVLAQLGANLITDQTQPFALPRTTATVVGGHVTTEGTNVAKENPTIGDIEFTYKSIEASTKLTRQFINGASVSAEAYIVDQLTKAVATALENAALNGTGANGQPKGLFKYTTSDGMNVKALGTNGGAGTWKDFVDVTGLVDTANAPIGARGWLVNPTTVAYLQSTPKVTGHPTFILDDSGLINGYSYASTSLVPNNLTKGTGTDLSALAFGSWEEMLIALFTGLDLFIDPFSAQPHVNVTVAQDYDVHLAHEASFAIVTDLKTAA